MSLKRLLFIQEDPVLSHVYQDRLESAGYTVETARDVNRGAQMLESIKPDLVILDPLPSGIELSEAISALRARGGAAAPVPIVILPTAHPSITQAAHDATATRVLDRDADPVAAVLSGISESLGEKKAAAPGSAELAPRLRESILGGVKDTIANMRQTLRDVTQREGDAEPLKQLLHYTHRLAAQAALLGPNAISHMASAMEVLVYGLCEFPERVGPLTIRTLGQALDFLSQVMASDYRSMPVNLSASHVLIVEDEANARELIVTAMDLVGLPADGLDNPSTSLAVLGTQPCDLIFLDINLPEMNGFELCTKLRAMPIHESTPIIFLTGMNTFQNRVQSNLSGGNDFIGKPFNIAELGVKALIWVLKGQLGLK